MSVNSSLNLVSLDIPAQMNDLRSFMRGQTAFKDYNYEGSTMSALLRIMAYNSYKNAFYINMMMGEAFLDTAQTLPAVLSHAKELNYLPRSAISSKASLSFTFNGTNPTYVLPKGTTFTAVVKNTGLNFSLADTILATSSNGFFTVATDVYEGVYQSDRYVVDYGQQNQSFILSNQNVDTNSLTVKLYQDGDINGSLLSFKTSLLDLDESSKVYFLQATGNGQYEVIFGDGVSGYRPPDGSTVVFDYRITKAEGGNGAQQFHINQSIGDGVSNVSPIYTVSASVGGSSAEDIESIRFNAPRHYQLQENAVTAQDYAPLLKMKFPEIRTASAVGGEDLNPPQYGRVIIAVDITDVDGLPSSKIDEYTNYIQSRCGLTVRPVFVEPAYTFIDVTSKVTYNLNVTTMTPSNISVLVLNQVTNFANNNIDDFGSILRYSKLVTTIDQSHTSIISNETVLKVYKKISPTLGVDNTLTISFGMTLYQGTPIAGKVFPSVEERCIVTDLYVSGSGQVFVTDDGAGNMWTATSQSSSTQLLQQVGTIDYTTGTIKMTKWNVQEFDGDGIKFFATTAEQDITSPHDTILQLETGRVEINVVETRE